MSSDQLPETTSSSSIETDPRKTVRFVERLYELEGRKFFFSSFSPLGFFNKENEPSSKDQIDSSLPSGWSWQGDWTMETSTGSHDGWTYSKHRQGSAWSVHEHPTSYFKRRVWTRARVAELMPEEVKDEYEVLEASELFQKITRFTTALKTAFKDVELKTKKPNILLLGGSGAGKSSLVNAVFGAELAEIGEGKPITKTYKKFARDDIPVVVYDSRGIEHGYIKEGFIADTIEFFKTIRSDPSLEVHIHCVWYVIDLTQARFQPFEAEFCQTHLKEIPTIFVLNKADAVSDEVAKTLTEVIESFKMPNCVGIFHTTSNCKNFDTKVCLKCGSGKIRKRLKGGSCTIMCKECGDNTTLEKTSGIEALAEATLSVLPNLVKEVFAFHQRANIEERDSQARHIIVKHSHDASLSKSDTMADRMAELTEELLRLYEVDMFTKMARDETKHMFAAMYQDQRMIKRAELFLTDMFKKKALAQAMMVCCGAGVVTGIHRLMKDLLEASLEHEQAPTDFNFTDELIRHIQLDVSNTRLKQAAAEIRQEGVQAYVQKLDFGPTH